MATPPFIAIEGLDGAGTTTQSRMLVDRLQAAGRPAVLTREPSDGPIGVLIRQMLSGRVVSPSVDGPDQSVGQQVLALLFASDRLDHLRAEVLPALADGLAVVSDRYYHSSFAYQGDVGDTDELDLRWVRLLNERARTPDVTVFLEAPARVCLSRIQARAGRDIYETRQMLEQLEQRYRQVIDALQADGEPIVRLDARRPKAELGAAIAEIVDDLDG